MEHEPVALDGIPAHRVSAFEPDSRYQQSWWEDLGWARGERGVDFWTFLFEGDEAARAVTLEHQIETPFRAFDRLGPTVEIARIEVLPHLIGQGFGGSAVQELRRLWPSHQFVAFSLEADGFWRSIGFEHHKRIDGLGGYSPFFAALPLNRH